MPKWIVQVQNCIDVEVEAETKEEARMKLVECDDLYYEDFLNTCTIHEPFLLGKDGSYFSEDSPLIKEGDK